MDCVLTKVFHHACIGTYMQAGRQWSQREKGKMLINGKIDRSTLKLEWKRAIIHPIGLFRFHADEVDHPLGHSQIKGLSPISHLPSPIPLGPRCLGSCACTVPDISRRPMNLDFSALAFCRRRGLQRLH